MKYFNRNRRRNKLNRSYSIDLSLYKKNVGRADELFSSKSTNSIFYSMSDKGSKIIKHVFNYFILSKSETSTNNNYSTPCRKFS